MKFRKLLLTVGLLASVGLVGCGDDNDDNNDNQVNNPAEVPTPTATPKVFKWASVRFDNREDTVQPPPPGTCGTYVRFEVQADGDYRYRNPCALPQKSGSITANELGALDALMNGISEAEAAAKEKCTMFNDDNERSDARLSMASTTNRRFSLYRQNDDVECVSGNPAEITNIRNMVYELQSKYSQP